ncbi:flagellar hook-basal body complex protein FliE [Devosia sp.]|uniref:flagellar hook-basal body complex protein FliE n=1 Tax=Devosia sp. TaxID=1871048 RepID=UPI00273668AB|nr:flagellar hook-basal body complex protein FliE [Devosia sp.]MDP2779454.1 flagellar hook-basal body complex protein FliE [Devosia sp.]
MAIASAAAANAYALTSRIANPAKPAPAAAEAAGFDDLLKQAVSAVEDMGKKTDAIGLQAAVGKADIVDVVTAVAETELALETLVSVRDRMISAYEEIMRMPI